MKTMGLRIKLVRTSLKMNQKQFSKAINISQGTLSDIENNKFTPSIKTVLSIINEFNICSNWIITGICQHDGIKETCPYYSVLLNLDIITHNL